MIAPANARASATRNERSNRAPLRGLRRRDRGHFLLPERAALPEAGILRRGPPAAHAGPLRPARSQRPRPGSGRCGHTVAACGVRSSSRRRNCVGSRPNPPARPSSGSFGHHHARGPTQANAPQLRPASGSFGIVRLARPSTPRPPAASGSFGRHHALGPTQARPQLRPASGSFGHRARGPTQARRRPLRRVRSITIVRLARPKHAPQPPAASGSFGHHATRSTQARPQPGAASGSFGMMRVRPTQSTPGHEGLSGSFGIMRVRPTRSTPGHQGLSGSFGIASTWPIRCAPRADAATVGFVWSSQVGSCAQLELKSSTSGRWHSDNTGPSASRTNTKRHMGRGPLSAVNEPLRVTPVSTSV